MWLLLKIRWHRLLGSPSNRRVSRRWVICLIKQLQVVRYDLGSVHWLALTCGAHTQPGKVPTLSFLTQKARWPGLPEPFVILPSFRDLTGTAFLPLWPRAGVVRAVQMLGRSARCTLLQTSGNSTAHMACFQIAQAIHNTPVLPGLSQW